MKSSGDGEGVLESELRFAPAIIETNSFINLDTPPIAENLVNPSTEQYVPKDSINPNKLDQKKLKKKPNFFKTLIIGIVLFAFTLFGFGGYVLVNRALTSAGAATGENAGDVFAGLFKNLTSASTPLAGQDNGRTNFLIIGVDGSGFLADSITFVSFWYDTKEFTSIHIPRDMTVKSEYGQTKINEFYSYSEQTGERNGPKALTSLLEEELLIKVHYWVQFNFSGVKDLIDQVGGVDVDVPRTFSDCDYPKDVPGVDSNCVYFKAGLEHMDGGRALIFSRSRHSYDNYAEATDFARGTRQSIVMESLLKKMLGDIKNKGNLFNPQKTASYLDTLGQNVHMSIKTAELKSFYDTFYKQLGGLDSIKFTKISWDTSSPLFTSNFSTPAAYIITYSDGHMMGDNKPSKARIEVQKEIADPRSVGKNVEAKKASLIVLGNNSGKVGPVFKELNTLGFSPCAECFYDQYSYIKTAANPKITFYVGDPTIRDEVKDMLNRASFQYTVTTGLPADKKLTADNQGTDIIVWIE